MTKPVSDLAAHGRAAWSLSGGDVEKAVAVFADLVRGDPEWRHVAEDGDRLETAANLFRIAAALESLRPYMVRK